MLIATKPHDAGRVVLTVNGTTQYEHWGGGGVVGWAHTDTVQG